MEPLTRLNATLPVLACRTKVATEFVSVSSSAANRVWITISKSRRRISPWDQDHQQRHHARSRSALRVLGSAPVGIHPEWGKIALTIKRLNRSSVLRARHVLLEFIRD